MSKVDALRALREARYAAAKTSGSKAGGKPISAVPDAAPSDLEAPEAAAVESGARAKKSAPVRKARTKVDPPALYAVPDVTFDAAELATSGASGGPAAEVELSEDLCGHRNMGGKSCSRPAGHSEKNHRYK